MPFRAVNSPEMAMLRGRIGLILAFAFFAGFASVVPILYARPRPPAPAEMQVAMPRFVQVLMAAGDRYLAANFAGFRALVVSTETMDADNYRILGQVQSDAAWLNPAHEDNYYIAAAILPWYGEVDAVQYILRQASAARPFDWQPAFYYGFNELHFKKNPVEGAEWLRLAASHSSDEMEQIQLQQMAANWVNKGEDLSMAVRLHRAMAKETLHKAFAAVLLKRATRLENLMALEQAIARYRELTGRNPAHLQELADQELLPSIPVDPFGARYIVDSNGKAQLASMGSGGERQ